MVKTFKIFSGTKRPITLKHGMQHRVLEYYQVCSNDDPVLTLTYLMARSNLVSSVFVWDRGKTMDFSETAVVYDIKGAVQFKGQGHSLTLFQCHSHSTFSNFVSLETARPIEAKLYMEPPWDGGMEVSTNGICHMSKMAAMPIYVKNIYKPFSLEPKHRWLWNLVCGIDYSRTIKFVQMMTLD